MPERACFTDVAVHACVCMNYRPACHRHRRAVHGRVSGIISGVVELDFNNDRQMDLCLARAKSPLVRPRGSPVVHGREGTCWSSMGLPRDTDRRGASAEDAKNEGFVDVEVNLNVERPNSTRAQVHTCLKKKWQTRATFFFNFTIKSSSTINLSFVRPACPLPAPPCVTHLPSTRRFATYDTDIGSDIGCIQKIPHFQFTIFLADRRSLNLADGHSFCRSGTAPQSVGVRSGHPEISGCSGTPADKTRYCACCPRFITKIIVSV